MLSLQQDILRNAFMELAHRMFNLLLLLLPMLPPAADVHGVMCFGWIPAGAKNGFCGIWWPVPQGCGGATIAHRMALPLALRTPRALPTIDLTLITSPPRHQRR